MNPRVKPGGGEKLGTYIFKSIFVAAMLLHAIAASASPNYRGNINTTHQPLCHAFISSGTCLSSTPAPNPAEIARMSGFSGLSIPTAPFWTSTTILDPTDKTLPVISVLAEPEGEISLNSFSIGITPATSFHPADINKLSICQPVENPSEAMGSYSNITFIGETPFISDRNLPASMWRGPAWLRKRMISDFCNELIRSSETNSNMLKTVSKKTPIRTYQNAALWTNFANLSGSYIIPMPRSAAAAISACNKYGLSADKNSSEKKYASAIGLGLLALFVAFSVLFLRKKMRDIDRAEKREQETLRSWRGFP
jgi:hypothetical protein